MLRPTAASIVHFQPSGYGFTAVGTYFIAFSIEAVGTSTFNVAAYAGPGTVSGAGSKTLNGQSVVTVILKNVPASQVCYAYVEQKAGDAWNWYSTRMSLPPLVISL